MRNVSVFAIFAMAGASLWAGGFGAGLQTSFPLSEDSVIVPRLDFMHSTDSSSSSGIGLSSKANIFSLGADYDYFPGGKTWKGFYGLGGVGVAYASIDVSGSIAGFSGSTTSNQTVPYPEIGAGYMFTENIGAEILYKYLDIKDVNLLVGGVPAGYSYSGGLQIAVVARF
jgi:hypothetical protein